MLINRLHIQPVLAALRKAAGRRHNRIRPLAVRLRKDGLYSLSTHCGDGSWHVRWEGRSIPSSEVPASFAAEREPWAGPAHVDPLSLAEAFKRASSARAKEIEMGIEGGSLSISFGGRELLVAKGFDDQPQEAPGPLKLADLAEGLATFPPGALEGILAGASSWLPKSRSNNFGVAFYSHLPKRVRVVATDGYGLTERQWRPGKGARKEFRPIHMPPEAVRAAIDLAKALGRPKGGAPVESWLATFPKFPKGRPKEAEGGIRAFTGREAAFEIVWGWSDNGFTPETPGFIKGRFARHSVAEAELDPAELVAAAAGMDWTSGRPDDGPIEIRLRSGRVLIRLGGDARKFAPVRGSTAAGKGVRASRAEPRAPTSGVQAPFPQSPLLPVMKAAAEAGIGRALLSVSEWEGEYPTLRWIMRAPGDRRSSFARGMALATGPLRRL